MFTTIAVALDGTERSQAAARYGAALAREHSGRIVVAHVRELIAGRGAGPLHVDEDERAASVRRTIADLRAQGLEVDQCVTSTLRSPTAAIADIARRAGADVIVTGGTNHGLLAGALTGSTPQGLLRAAHCPVLVAPAREPARPSLPAGATEHTPIAA
jgi:nucleotide-binding universal stress UspA family protein